MGKTLAEVKLTNFGDLILVRRGIMGADEVRSQKVEALVDTGATMVSITKDIATNLGLEPIGRRTVRYANGKVEEKEVVGGILLEILGREAEVDAIVEEKSIGVLIGQVPLELLDLIVDPKSGLLGPRPESPDMPLIDML